MKKLSKEMLFTINTMKAGELYSAYDLTVSLNTLRALYNRGLVKYNAGLGSTWSPRTSIDWWITKKGLELKEKKA